MAGAQKLNRLQVTFYKIIESGIVIITNVRLNDRDLCY